jgi:hypothetical protein
MGSMVRVITLECSGCPEREPLSQGPDKLKFGCWNLLQQGKASAMEGHDKHTTG